MNTTTASNAITLDEILRRPFQALTIRELDALDAADNKQGEK